jgi:hypothetical protein
MNKTLFYVFTFLVLNTLTLAAVYQAKMTTSIIQTNLQEYYENVLDEVLSSRGKDFLLSMGRMRPDRRGGVFETLQKEAVAFGVHDMHGKYHSNVMCHYLSSFVIKYTLQLHVSSNSPIWCLPISNSCMATFSMP